MENELSLGIKIAAGLAVCLCIVSFLWLISTVVRSKASEGYSTMMNKVQEDEVQNIKQISAQGKPVSAPTIYRALYDYGFENLEEFTFVHNGIIYTDPEEMTKHFDCQYYVSYVETNFSLIVKVGDGSA